MHILSPETDNCPSWISRRERMTVENISWSISTKECYRPRRGLNPWPPGLQLDGASNWATEAGPLQDIRKVAVIGHSLEEPLQGASNEYPEEIRKIFNWYFLLSTAIYMIFNAQKGPLCNLVDKAGPDQPALMCRLIWAYVISLQNQWILQYMSTNRKCPD